MINEAKNASCYNEFSLIISFILFFIIITEALFFKESTYLKSKTDPFDNDRKLLH